MSISPKVWALAGRAIAKPKPRCNTMAVARSAVAMDLRPAVVSEVISWQPVFLASTGQPLDK